MISSKLKSEFIKIQENASEKNLPLILLNGTTYTWFIVYTCIEVRNY